MAKRKTPAHIKIGRKAFESLDNGGDPFWNERRVLSRWEAWQFFIKEAGWGERDFAVRGGDVVTLARGETKPLAIRTLMQAFGWGSKKRVSAFLETLRSMDRLRVQRRTPSGDTYFVVNYDKWQGGGDTDGDAHRDTNGDSSGDAGGDNKEASKANITNTLSENDMLFELAWSEYPRLKGHSKAAAKKAWDARIANDPSSPKAMLDGVRMYAAHCKAMAKEQQFIMHAATFFGPNLHYAVEFETEADPQVLPMRKREEDEYAAFVAKMQAEMSG